MFIIILIYINIHPIIIYLYIAGRNSEISGTDRIHEDRTHGNVQSSHQTESRWLL